MKLEILNIQYHPNQNTVSCLLEHELGIQFYVNLTQEQLQAVEGVPDGRWSDEEVLPAVQNVLDTSEEPALKKFRGHTVTYREAPPAEESVEEPSGE